MIVVTSQITVVKGQEEAFIAASKAVVLASLAEEEGCLLYACSRDISDPSAFVFIEEWADGAAIREHITTAHYVAFSEAAKATIASQVTKLHTVENTRVL